MLLRYFNQLDGPFVQNIYKTVANIPLQATLDDSTAVEILSSDSVLQLSEQMGLLEISIGDHENLPAGKGLCSKPQPPLAYTYINIALGGAAYVCLCEDI